MNDVAYDEVGIRISTKMQAGLMKIVEKQLKQRMKQEINVQFETKGLTEKNT